MRTARALVITSMGVLAGCSPQYAKKVVRDCPEANGYDVQVEVSGGLRSIRIGEMSEDGKFNENLVRGTDFLCDGVVDSIVIFGKNVTPGSKLEEMANARFLAKLMKTHSPK